MQATPCGPGLPLIGRTPPCSSCSGASPHDRARGRRSASAGSGHRQPVYSGCTAGSAARGRVENPLTASSQCSTCQRSAVKEGHRGRNRLRVANGAGGALAAARRAGAGAGAASWPPGAPGRRPSAGCRSGRRLRPPRVAEVAMKSSLRQASVHSSGSPPVDSQCAGSPLSCAQCQKTVPHPPAPASATGCGTN